MAGYYLSAIMASDTITYENPVPWTCVDFSGCSNWQTTTTVSWSLPNTTYGVLYVSDKCNPNGQSSYITNRKMTTDAIPLLKKKKFRSMMVAEYKVDRAHRQEIKYVKKCSKELVELGVVGSNVNTNDTSTSEDLSSSNWYDDFPEV